MRLRPFLLVLLISWFPLLLVSSVTGCSCTQDPIQAKLDEAKKKMEEEKKKKAKPKPDYEMGLLTVQPNNLVDRQFLVKPGHLSSVTVDMIANNFDIKGELVLDPLDVDGVAYALGNSRPALLPKDSKRNLEMVLKYPPLVPGKDRVDLKTFSCRMNADGGRMLQSTPARLSRMPAHQFYFFVLAKSQDSYRFLSQMPAFKPTTNSLPGDDPQAFYRLVLPPVIQRAPLPSTSLAWTSMAYLVWDDMPRDSLTLEQQEALIDWIHWGGQLIVSGPGSLPLLKGSFLEPYLPVEGGESHTLEQTDFANFLHFAEGDGWRGPERISKPWECQILNPKSDSDRILMSVGANILRPLVVERNVGRGRVVVTAFRLTQPEIAEWRSYWPKFDEFFSGFILRRNPRVWQYLSADEAATMAWHVDGKNRIAQSPREASRMSYFSRDTGAAKHKPEYLVGTGYLDQDTLDRFEGTGPAAWDDFNDVSHSARNTIEKAAGIKVPERMFVVKVLALYLFVLVPLNWCVFGLMRKLEWAWIAVPIITVVFTGVVVKMAQLNIGFARSRTEIAVVEVQGEHPRAHVTRYTALYTSLTTRYDIRLTDPSGAVEPLSGKEELPDFQLSSRKPLWMLRDDQVRLSGFEVGSNSRGILHAEQMFELGGPIKVLELTEDSVKVTNDSEYELRDAQVIGPAGVAKLGTLSAGGSAQGTFIKPDKTGRPRRAEGEPGGPADATDEELSAGMVSSENYGSDIRLADLVAVAGLVTDKSVRLIAWSDEILPGMEVEPQASQNQHANLFVVHLRPPAQPKAKVDQFVKSQDDPEAKFVLQTFLKKPTKPKPLEEIELPPE